jgi:hypothetical protein
MMAVLLLLLLLLYVRVLLLLLVVVVVAPVCDTQMCMYTHLCTHNMYAIVATTSAAETVTVEASLW